MTKQEIIDAFDVAQRLLGLVELVASEEARIEMISAAETIIGSVTDDDEAIDIILQALKAEADPGQLRELIEENGRLKRELEGTCTRLEAELTYYKEQLRAKEDELAYYKKQTLAAYTAVDEEPEDSTEGEIDAEAAPSAPAKKPRKATPRHTWITAEDAWIAEHLNSVRSGEVAERFGVSEKAAYTRMMIVKGRLGKS